MMTKNTATALTLLVAVIAIAVPVSVAIWMSRSLSLDAESNRSLLYAQDLVARAEAVADQMAAGFSLLTANAGDDPCSDANIERMREIDLGSSYIQALGRVEGTRMVCSSLGRVGGGGFDLGPVGFTTDIGTTVRKNVRFDFAPDTSFIVTQAGDYAAIIHKALPIDTTTQEPDAVLGVYMLEDEEALTARGTIRPEWLTHLLDGTGDTFISEDHVVSTVRSNRYFVGAVAAIPLAYMSRRTQSFAWLLVPIGLLAGGGLAFAVLKLAKMQLALPAVIRTALRRDEFFLAYQPIVDLQSGAIVGAEALLRWRRPGGEIVRPDIFIPVAEDSGLIRQITTRVIELIARDAQGLFDRQPDFHLSLNLSAQDFLAPELNADLQELQRATHARAGNIYVEVTERSFIDHESANKVLQQLQSHGFRIAIDDFGTGYSSLSSLANLDLDFLKIDRSFVNTLGTEAPTSHVVTHIIQMAKGLHLQMIAEGVETEAQAQNLRGQGVQFAQGWLFGKPVSFGELLAAVAKQSI